ncbi:scarecrow-like protein 3 [Aegilops tauschii subsp. strangulata]|uniref:scarecrow-like protein 3 n=1 Tax=Aegilops tauschii subsp. strangulata TaxID=200361 RepID=UPI000989BF50|nr:GRAS family protein RAM1-like [Aegilops tauschii subsp. strangulata]
MNGTTTLLVLEERSAAAPTIASLMAPAPQNQYEQRAIDLITLLYSRATAFAKGDKELINKGLERICSSLASHDVGGPLHHLASSFAEALALRVVQLWQGVCRALQLHKITPAPAAAAGRRHFAEMWSFLHLARTTANYAIIDAAQTERNAMLHVVHLSGAEATQWLLLLLLFAKCPGAGTHDQMLHLTIVNKEDEFLSITRALLARVAESLHIGFQFHPVKLHVNQLLNIEPLGVRSCEELVILSTLQLHHLLADEFVEVATRPHDRKGKAQAHATMMRADTLLRDLAELSPKLMVVTEQDADHYGEFMGRLDNTLKYYGTCLMPWRRAYMHAG